MRHFLNFAGTKNNRGAERSHLLHIKTEKQLRNLYRKEISHWRNARASRYHPDQPSTHALQEVYADAMIDAHLTAVVNNRILYVQNKRYVVKGQDNKVNPQKTKLLAQGWFRELVRYAMESIFYGYSLIWLKTFQGNRVSAIELIDRRHVIPERGLIVQNVYDREGTPFTQYPHHLLYAQFDNSIGLLERAAPLAILKRHSWANWDEFEQLFGIPIRIAKVPNLEAKGVHQVERWLDQMGTAAYAILPTSAEIEIKDGNRSDAHQVFSEKINTVNAELSKLVNGQTMTVDSGSSRSQSEVHERTQQEIRKADMDNFLWWVNQVLMPALRFHGYPFLSHDYVDNVESSLPSERIKIDEILLRSGVRLSKNYLEETYDVSIAEDPPPNSSAGITPAAEGAEQKMVKSMSKRPRTTTEGVITHADDSTKGAQKGPGAVQKDAEEDEMEVPPETGGGGGLVIRDDKHLAEEEKRGIERYVELLTDLLDGLSRGFFFGSESQLTESSKDEYYVRVIRSRVMSNVFSHIYRGMEEKGVGLRFSSTFLDSPNYKLLKELRTNAGVFFSFKYHHLNREALSLLTDKDGKVRPLAEFSKELHKLSIRHNTQLLRQEYEQAIATAISAKKWHDHQSTRHLYPNLRYIARQDGATRQSHRSLHNLVFPVGHSFWNTHYPPNGWNCRCTVEATEDEPTQRGDRAAREAPKVQEPFNFNPGKEGKITTDSHLYFKMPQKKYQKVLNVARHALQHHNKREVLTIMKNRTLNAMTHNQSGLTIEALSRNKMKSILNQPHDYKYEKDTILYHLERVFTSSDYLGGVRNRNPKNKDKVLVYHYFSFRSPQDPRKKVLPQCEAV